MFSNQNIKRLYIGLAVLVISFSSQALGNSMIVTPVGQDDCDLSRSDPKQLVAFLNQQAISRSDPGCVEFAIEALEFLRPPAAVPALISFLDFPEPLSPQEEKTRSIIISSHYLSRYKAVEALFDIGEPAIPSLLTVLQTPATSPIKFKNALAAYLDIRRGHRAEAIKQLNTALATNMCPSLQNADEKELQSFLESNVKKGSGENGNCVAFAILQAGIAGSANTAKLLPNFLDYEWSPSGSDTTASDPDHPLLYAQQHYPAVTALYLIGSPTLIQLLHILKNPETPALVRSKAVETIMLVYSEYPPQGITVINSASKKDQRTTQDQTAKLAASAVQWCDIDHRVMCQQALRGTN